jgi:hypothetical protein
MLYNYQGEINFIQVRGLFDAYIKAINNSHSLEQGRSPAPLINTNPPS